MTLNERELFEQLPKVSEILKDQEIEFSESDNQYYHTIYTTFVPEEIHFLNGAWFGWQEKAKAQAVPASHTHSVTLTCAELKEAYDFGAPDESHEQLTDLVTIGWHENGHSGSGYYAYMTECEDEGSIKLGESESGAEG